MNENDAQFYSRVRERVVVAARERLADASGAPVVNLEVDNEFAAMCWLLALFRRKPIKAEVAGILSGIPVARCEYAFQDIDARVKAIAARTRPLPYVDIHG